MFISTDTCSSRGFATLAKGGESVRERAAWRLRRTFIYWGKSTVLIANSVNGKCPIILDRPRIDPPFAVGIGVSILDKQAWHRLLFRHRPLALVAAWDSRRGMRTVGGWRERRGFLAAFGGMNASASLEAGTEKLKAQSSKLKKSSKAKAQTRVRPAAGTGRVGFMPWRLVILLSFEL